jgi:hypothetical protein
MFINSDNALLLAQKLENIPNVIQVRFHYVVRDDLKESLGPETIIYTAFVEALDQSNAPTGAKSYEKFRVSIQKDTYENPNNHGPIQAMLSERIGHYYRTGERIDTAGSFSYPYRMDADGNQIPYEMIKNNPQR